MSLIGLRTKRLKNRSGLLVITLLVCLGTGCVSDSGGKFPIHARPFMPLAITEPSKVFLRCGGNSDAVESLYYCIETQHLEELREFTIRMFSLVEKYEHATRVLNE
jgi:hypothetical protein